ncbi:MAG TPA: hypothetical protein VHT97_09720 [Acidimicrobiales bacterium]|nr:hypothetical protein [Acidimicrobiales bacterium]
MSHKARLLVPAAAAAAYTFVLRPRFLHWGATEAEVDQPLPGDELVGAPRYTTTRGVHVVAGAGRVWPWLVQMGQGRGGLYSYDWLENLVGVKMHSGNVVAPEHQQLAVGDAIWLVPRDAPVPLRLKVAVLDPGHALVLQTPREPDEVIEGFAVATWAFVLTPSPGGGTRLLVRWRADYKPTVVSTLASHYLLEPVHFVMERKMLLGIKARAEALTAWS